MRGVAGSKAKLPLYWQLLTKIVFGISPQLLSLIENFSLS